MYRESMKQKARRLWGDNRQLRHQWFTAVKYLRRQSRDGWLADRRVNRVEIQQQEQQAS